MFRDFLRLAVAPTAVAAALTALAYWPAVQWGAGDGVRALLFGAGTCLTGALLGRLVIVVVRRADPSYEGAARALQVGMTVRLLGTLVLALPVVLAGGAPLRQVAAWLGLHYAGQLVLEVFVSLRELGQNHDPSGSTERGTEPSAGRETPVQAESITQTTKGDESA